jgi:uncharacterized protein (TIGR02271 family)
MFTDEEVRSLPDATAYDQAGQKIGRVATIYQDQATGEPEWLTVKTGLFGMKESFVPLALARQRGAGEVELAASKDTITGAPQVDPDAELTKSEEEQLFRYYGLGYSERRSPTGLPETGQGVPGGTPTTPPGAHGRDVSGPTTDTAMTRSEERMRVGTATEETGRARLRKYVVTETVQRTVPVSHEEVRVEREPITDANREAAMSGPAISDEEHEVTLHAERPVVEKEVEPVERVRLTTERVAGEETVSGDIRKEQIEQEGDTGSSG